MWILVYAVLTISSNGQTMESYEESYLGFEDCKQAEMDYRINGILTFGCYSQIMQKQTKEN
jgi:hypothetical protein